jgi:endonuclease/exonuclease/phosphatase family metal-dependent hydrolase
MMIRWRLNPDAAAARRRIALRARTAGLVFYSVHLESGGGDELRTSQLHDVLADAARQPAGNMVIAGDFNNRVAFQSFMFSGVAAAGFADAVGSDGERRTSINHRHPIDWMFVRGATARSGHVERVEDASDHYPIVATLSTWP